MNITGRDITTHSLRPSTAPESTGQASPIRQRPQNATQRTGTLSLGEMGRRMGNLIGLRQRNGTEPRQAPAGADRASTSRAAGPTLTELFERSTRQQDPLGLGRAARRVDGHAIDRILAEDPSLQETAPEPYERPAPTLGEILEHKQTSGRFLSSRSNDSMDMSGSGLPTDGEQPTLARSSGRRFEGDLVERAKRPAQSSGVEGIHERQDSLERSASFRSAQTHLSSPASSSRYFTAAESEGSDSEPDQPPLDRSLANRYHGRYFSDQDERLSRSDSHNSSTSGSSRHDDSPIRHDPASQPEGLEHSRAGRFDESWLHTGIRHPSPFDSAGTSTTLQREDSTNSQASSSSTGSVPDDQPALDRARARHFQNIDIDRIMAYNPARQSTTSLEMGLDGKGRLKLGDNTPESLRQLLENTLGKPERTYLAHHGQPDGDQLLMDKQGNLLHLQQTPAAIVVMRSSRPSEAMKLFQAATNGQVASYGLEREGDSIVVSARGQNNRRRVDQEVTGRAHIAQVSGIHEDAEGQRLRVHDGHLYRFDVDKQAWQPHPGDDGKPFSQLGLQADGRLYALHDGALLDMSAEAPRPPVEAQDARSFSVAADGTVALLCGSGDAQHIRLRNEDGEITAPLKLDDGNAEAVHVGLDRDRLFLTDNEGRLYSAGRNAGGFNLRPEPQGVPQGETLGRTQFAEGFMQDDQARLNLLFKDRQGHMHSQPISRSDVPLHAGWNLSDALVIDNRRGLPNVNPDPLSRLSLGRLGHVALEGGELQRWDSVANAWASTGIKGIERLQLGLDGKPYVLQDGKLSGLGVSPTIGRFAHDGSQSLAPTGVNIQVSMGSAVVDGPVRDFALVNDKLFVTLDGEGQLNLHDNGKPARPLPLRGLEGEPRSLALDKQQNLYVLTEGGHLYSLPRKDWQATEATPRDPGWGTIGTPDNQPVASIRTGSGNTLLVALQGKEEELQHDGTDWQPHTPAPLTPPQVLKALFERVRDDNKTWNVLGHTVKVTGERLGRTGVENRHRSGTAEFIRAHIFKPTLEPPRPLKNLGYNLQHRWQGREGLAGVYEQEGAAFDRLRTIAQGGSAKPAEGADLKSRIARLGLGEEGKPLAKALETFRTELEDSISQTLINLGKEKGLLNLHGEPRDGFKAPLLGGIKQKLNPFSTGEDLNHQLRDALAQLGSEPHRSAELLGLLEEKGVMLSPQKSEVPLGRRRDPSDDSALLKARLALDVTTLHELNQLVEQIGAAPEAMELGVQALSQLRDHQYGDSPLKVVTDMGFRGHDSLEADYDAVKAFLNAFKKTDHAVHINLRTAFGGDSADMAKGLKAALKEIEGDHELHIHRNYGGALSTPTTGPGGKLTFPNGRLTGDRGYSLTFEIIDDKLTATFVRQGGGSASVGAGVRDRTLKRNHDLGPDRAASFSFPLDVYAKGTLGANQRDALLFTLAEGEIDAFVDDLMQGKLNPYELMKKGSNHEVQHGYRVNFDIDAGASVNLGYGFNLHETGSPFSGIARFRGAVEVNLNLLNYSHYRQTNTNSAGRILEEGGLNRPRLLNRAEIKFAAQAQLLAGHEDEKAKKAAKAAKEAGLPEVPVPFETTGMNLGGSLSASVDMKTTKRFKFLFKPAQPLTGSDLTKLGDTLGKAFKDKASTARLAEIAKEEDLDKHLSALQEAFGDKEVINDDQHAALKSLRQAGDRHEAAKAGHNMLDYMRLESSYTNLSRLDQASLLTRLSAELNPSHVQSNSEYLANLMNNDPKLEALIKQLQDTPGTLARVRLEFKDEVAARVDKGSRDGTLTQDELVALLSDRDNMRLKAIMVYQTESKSEGFVSPLPLVGYNSSTSLSLIRALGRVNFEYGQDQSTPKGYKLDGDIAEFDKPTQQSIAALKSHGYTLKQ
ncbi:AvrE-family type 3 secretion system effector [Pseudomonas indica]|uniref:AvrE-family type 3 secretion system effector n=1 Tax=Pseudomonas indica TaxID=137658 RepID=UPI003FD1DD6B